jgi:hypothetical protein
MGISSIIGSDDGTAARQVYRWRMRIGGQVLNLAIALLGAAISVMKPRSSRFVAALMLLGVSGWCAAPRAQADPLVADRPDFTESTETVGPGRLQLEAGYTFFRMGEEELHSLGELLLRIGLLEQFELRLAGNSYVWLESPSGNDQGFVDMSLGAKIKLLEAAEHFDVIRPNVALIFGTTLPTGSIDLSADEPQPAVKLALSWAISERLSSGSNLNYAYLSEDGERFHQFSGSLTLGYKLTEKWGTYIEYFGFVPASKDGPNESFFDGGVTYLVNDDLQLDARAGVGAFNGKSPDYFVGVGLAWRWHAW